MNPIRRRPHPSTLFLWCLMTTLPAAASDAPAPAPASATEPIRYSVRFPAPQTHYVEVEARIPAAGKADVELMMPVWTPGSYLVREYARGIEGFAARKPDGSALEAVKSRKNRWKITTGGADEVVVAYRVYGRTMAVQANWIDSAFAMLQGAATFVTLADGVARPHEVVVDPAPGWKQSVTALPAAPGGKPHHYVAADFDALVDSPIYAGNPALYEFTVDGVPHVLLNEGEGGLWDGPRSARDVEAIVRAEKAFWGSLPYDRYVFFNILGESGGGLEHKNSTVLMASRWATRTRSAYLAWLNLVAHEFFHTWNVKRMRPVELGPFDYENEVHTPSLWVAEGTTSYYDRLMVRRAGLCSLAEYLAGDPPSAGEDRTINDVERLQTTPGRLVQSLEESSYDTWIKFYRRDENTPNTQVSYYVKGAVVAFLLDAEIRRATNDAKSLDDAMRLAYSRYSGDKGFTSEEFQKTAAEVAGTDLSEFFHRALRTTDELDYARACDWFGLRFAKDRPEKKSDADKENEKDKDKPAKAWLGLTTKTEDGRLIVAHVRRETPGFDAGFNVGDEILGVGDDRIPPSQWSKRLEAFRPGDKLSILIARRDRFQRLDVVLGQEPPRVWTMELIPDPTDAQKAHRKTWLGE
ncbi:M61 family metallopeptidase [Planctomyces sp. SH-PL62]|uniref:M61 family metallopeptidase n=1 Tax=Planctomyces sp. SH-PL62 TaxID=1636152 RepID=UPI00078DF77B|nr:PDZ domain-containing protein [Planctomyces sp. SH-PL62]AMV40742.1 M61 glycyl aminopeptidase [Planctomyces sp. SH-PL62]